MTNYLKLFTDADSYNEYTGVTESPNNSHLINDIDLKGLPDYKSMYLSFIAVEDGTFTFSGNSASTVSYTVDGGKTWSEPQNVATTPLIKSGKRVMWKGDIVTILEYIPPSSYPNVYANKFTSTNKFNVEGNIHSLLYLDEFAETETIKDSHPYIFYGLFVNSKVVNAEHLQLPATSMTMYAYSRMFSNCKELKKAPMELPSKYASKQCYGYMFSGCDAMEVGPEILMESLFIDEGSGSYSTYAMTNMFEGCTSMIVGPSVLKPKSVTDSSYYCMFKDCKSLKKTPELNATNVSSNGYQSMFEGCSSLVDVPSSINGTSQYMCCNSMFKDCTSLKVAPNLPSYFMAGYVYANMFEGCTSLIKAPDLMMTSLEQHCYESMFKGCTSLVTMPKFPETASSPVHYGYCYASMFEGCSSLKEVHDLPKIGGSPKSGMYINMFKDCISLKKAPEIPKTQSYSSATYYYQGMFEGCTSLIEAPSFIPLYLSTSCCERMYAGCTSLVKAPNLPATSLASNCYKEMFDGCSNLNYIKASFTYAPSTNTTENWVRGVSPTGTFLKLSSATWDVRGVNGIPDGWEVETF